MADNYGRPPAPRTAPPSTSPSPPQLRRNLIAAWSLSIIKFNAPSARAVPYESAIETNLSISLYL
jgi:hypothetical protein